MNTIFYNYLEQKQTYKYESKYHSIGRTYDMHIKKWVCFIPTMIKAN